MKDKKNTYDDWGGEIYFRGYEDIKRRDEQMDDPNDFFEELDFSEPYPTKKTDRRLLLTKRR